MSCQLRITYPVWIISWNANYDRKIVETEAKSDTPNTYVRTQLKTGMDAGDPERMAVPAPLGASVVLLL